MRPALIALFIVVNGTTAHARSQAPRPNDPIPDTSAVEDSTAIGGHPPPIMEGLILMPLAPGALASILKKEPGPEFPPLAFWDRRVGLHLAGGVALAYSDSNTWAYSGGVEVLLRGMYAEVRDEHFRLPEHVEYRTVRVGYLVHPVPEIAGGFTLGYRDARGVLDHDGVELGFPFVTGGRRWTVRYEAAYVISSRMVSWNYRFQADYTVRSGPWYVGINVEGKTLPLRVGSKVSSVPVAVVLGARY